MSDIWGLRCRMFRGSYGRSCMRLVPVDLSYFWTPAYIASLSVTSCPLIPTMKYKSIFHHPIRYGLFMKGTSTPQIFWHCVHASRLIWIKIYQRLNDQRVGVTIIVGLFWKVVVGIGMSLICFCRNHIDDCPTHGAQWIFWDLQTLWFPLQRYVEWIWSCYCLSFIQ